MKFSTIGSPSSSEKDLPSSVSRSETTAFSWIVGKGTEELVVRPILLQDIPDAGCRAQSHNIPRIQKRSHSFPARPSPHFLQTLCASNTDRHQMGTEARTKTICEPKLQHSYFFGDVLQKRLAGRWPWTTCDVQHAGVWMDPNDAGTKWKQHTERRKRILPLTGLRIQSSNTLMGAAAHGNHV